MVKKVLALAFGLVLAVSAMAQWGSNNPTVPQSDIQFWTGTGSNRAVIAITWEDANEDYIGIAWGVQWNGGSIMLKSLMDTIAAYDSRFTMDFSSNWVNNLSYVDTALGLNLVGEDGWWWYNWLDSNDTDRGSAGVLADMVQTGDFVDWMQLSVADTMIMATDPNATDDPQPEESTIAFSDIIYWVGNGANEAVMAVNWADTALAWGYKFDGNKTVADMMDDIAAADPRFSYTIESGFLGDILFVKGEGDTLRKPAYSWWESKNNGISDAGMTQPLVNGDFEKWAVPEAGVIVDSMEYDGFWYYTYVYTMTIYPVSTPTPVESTIAFSDILYWVGTGANEAVMAVNWADTALAWGYKFDGNKTVADMMDDITAADPRFSYTIESGFLGDILFVKGEGDTLHKPAYSWWESKNNGISDAGMTQPLVNGDFEKWAVPEAGVIVDSMEYDGFWYYTYVYTMPIHPVSVPTSEGITVAEGMTLSVYPNPAVSSVKVSFDALESAGEVVLFDMTGRRVIAMPVAAGSTEAQIAVNSLANGVYLLRVGDATAKVVVR